MFFFASWLLSIERSWHELIMRCWCYQLNVLLCVVRCCLRSRTCCDPRIQCTLWWTDCWLLDGPMSYGCHCAVCPTMFGGYQHSPARPAIWMADCVLRLHTAVQSADQSINNSFILRWQVQRALSRNMAWDWSCFCSAGMVTDVLAYIQLNIKHFISSVTASQYN